MKLQYTKLNNTVQEKSYLFLLLIIFTIYFVVSIIYYIFTKNLKQYIMKLFKILFVTLIAIMGVLVLSNLLF